MSAALALAPASDATMEAAFDTPTRPARVMRPSTIDRVRASLIPLERLNGMLRLADGTPGEDRLSQSRRDVARLTGERASLSLESRHLLDALVATTTQAGHLAPDAEIAEVAAVTTAARQAHSAMAERLVQLERELRARRRLQIDGERSTDCAMGARVG